MTAKELKRIFQKGECLSLDTMRLYIDGKLNKKSMHEVEKHLVECGLCTAAMDGLTPRRMAEINKLSSHIERRLAVYMNTPPRVPFFRRYAGVLALGAVLIGIGFTWWYFANRNNQQQPKNQDTVSQPAANTGIVNPATDLDPASSSVVSQNNPSAEKAIGGNQQPIAANQANSAASAEKNSGTSAAGSQENTSGNTNQQNSANPPANNDNNQQAQGPNTRTATPPAQPIRIKSIIVYPPVTHDENVTRRESHDGQIGKSSGSTAAFKQDEMPSYPGGDQALKAYLMNNFKPIQVDRSKVTKYSTGIRFVVNVKTGTVSAPELSFSISPEVDAELMRIIKAMPSWDPGKKRGEVDIMLGVTFE